jgi:REP element-mobilizing transposase RayT
MGTMIMGKRDYLRRRDDADYQGHAIVHWTMTIRDRRTGWLDARFYYHFRELLTHSQFRYAIACPIFCLMPDHLHLMWMGILESSDQRLSMRHLRKRLNASLSRVGHELQDQPYDHVLSAEERQEDALMATCEYIARNPERAGLVPVDGYAD